MWLIPDVKADPTAPMAAKWPDGFIANIADVCVEDYRYKNRSGKSEASQLVVKVEQPLPVRKSNKDEQNTLPAFTGVLSDGTPVRVSLRRSRTNNVSLWIGDDQRCQIVINFFKT